MVYSPLSFVTAVKVRFSTVTEALPRGLSRGSVIFPDTVPEPPPPVVGVRPPGGGVRLPGTDVRET
jgi:hypothetical protein